MLKQSGREPTSEKISAKERGSLLGAAFAPAVRKSGSGVPAASTFCLQLRGDGLAVKIHNGRGFDQGTDGGDAAATMSCGGVAAASPPSHPFLRWCAETLTKKLVNSRPGAPLLQRRIRQNVLHRYGLEKSGSGGTRTHNQRLKRALLYH